jgi:SulP family sulfate permease
MRYTPNLISTLREGNAAGDLRADAVAGLTVAIVAAPLSMAIAVAAGATPAMGLTTAIVGGFLASALGGSRFQIGGPAGAFIVLVAAPIEGHGIEGLILATALSGVILAALGMLRLGSYVQFVPFPVTVGFTAGIALIIFTSQLEPLLGLTLAGATSEALVEKGPALWAALPTADPATCAVSAGAIAVMLGLRRWRPAWPGMLIAIVAAALVARAFAPESPTIGSVFGALPALPPAPRLPGAGLPEIVAVLPAAASFALLGAIESLLSAVVADGMSGQRHDSDAELIGQGAANVAAALFGGFCVTGTIARTATNVRAGARTPVSGMLHAAFLLGFFVVAAPLVAYVPLAALAAVLSVVAWDMVEKPAFAALSRASRGDAAVLFATLALTLFRDLTEAIVVGVALGAVLFIHRMATAVAVEPHDAPAGTHHEAAEATDPDVMVYRVRGALFFGAVSAVAAVLDRLGDAHRALILDCADVTLVDASAARMIEGMAHKARRRGATVYLTGTTAAQRRVLLAHGARPPTVRYAPTIDAARARDRRQSGGPAAASES